ncbi:uncharacterized protein LOC110734673 [Chenopodium quinoa]|uniref:uncharacterized protein LOC110734673 n=1 Tax=Chenopodium quinoa TaxID=63459 RepID=UPI000B7904A5|nr:uncharacterized protein LOC110734673 [Chenopodium quinoa]
MTEKAKSYGTYVRQRASKRSLVIDALSELSGIRDGQVVDNNAKKARMNNGKKKINANAAPEQPNSRKSSEIFDLAFVRFFIIEGAIVAVTYLEPINGLSLMDSVSEVGESSAQGALRNQAKLGQPKEAKKKTPAPKKKKEPLAAIGQPLPTASLQMEAPHVCLKCGAKKFQYKWLHFCCGNGSIKIASNDFPPELHRLFTSQDEDALHFRQYVRMYNSLFAFCSLGGDYNAKTEKGIYVFLLHGQIYHNLPDLLPGNEKPKYLQLYFYDARFEAVTRSKVFLEVRRDIVDILMRVTSINPYARFFRSLRDLTVTHSTQIVISQSTVLDQRVYNAPSTDEVAAIWPDSMSSSEYSGPHIIVSGKSTRKHRICHYYGCYDPLQYPLLFPYGDCGWTQGLRKTYKSTQKKALMDVSPVSSCVVHSEDSLLEQEANRSADCSGTSNRHISAREYYAYKLQIRPGNMLLLGGRCFQQYIVDMYVKIENTRLDFFRRNQQTIRVDMYQGILDTVDDGEKSANNIGRRVILPPSFIGGPRDMKKRYLNAMALVQRFGKPDLFVTMTCNANWPEITAELADTETAADRPDVVARVFRSKLIALKKQITEEQVFGKLTGPADYDTFVSAEIPSTDSPQLRKIILKHMMHGPCGSLNPKCGCMKKKVKDEFACKYNYPKSYVEETTTNEDSYPLYRRRNTGEHVRIHGANLDNRWVIPYNPYLSLLFDCHLNVEVCSTIQAVKYLYEYVYKGHDRVSFNVAGEGNEGVDEIENFQAGRWVSPCEAAWRIFGFDLFEMTPSVMLLPVHIKNASLPRGTGLTYTGMITEYRWDSSNKEWIKRSYKKNNVGRMAFVVPSEGERFFLHLLLGKVKSPISFDHLKTVCGVLYSTFQEAAIKLGLFQEDNAITACLEEAAEAQMPSEMRQLFATLLIFCQPSNPNALWLRFYSSLSEDFKHKYPDCPSKVKSLTVKELKSSLEAMGKTLEYFELGHLVEEAQDGMRVTRDIADALEAPIPPECLDCRDKLNAAQAAAFNSIMCYIQDGKPGCFFVDGPGGTGKTFLYNVLYAEVRLAGKIVLPTATSGIAASNIPSGRTTHSRFKIPLDSEISLACDVPKQGSLAALIKEVVLIIWDEASMARRENIESLDLLLRDLCYPDQPFGGKVIVFVGDFRQVLPILPRRTQKEAVGLVESAYVQIPQHIIRYYAMNDDPVSELAATIFPEISVPGFDSNIFNERAILTPMNEDVDTINEYMIKLFPGTSTVYESYDSILDDSCTLYPTEFLNTLCPGGMSPQQLELKIGSPVILMRNLAPSKGMCNGTRLICRRFLPNSIICEIVLGHYKGTLYFVPRVNLRPSSSCKYPFQFERKQFPLKLSFAMTINKSQGQTLSQVLIYLPQPCFSHGQLYVALSRAKKSDNVTVYTPQPPATCTGSSVKNIVSYDVLRLANIITCEVWFIYEHNLLAEAIAFHKLAYNI